MAGGTQLELLRRELTRRILVLDGAMGTMIQGYGLGEGEYRGSRFRDHPRDLKGNHDLLVLTRPDVVEEIHRSYLAAGADIIETDTFTATSIAQADYDLGDVAGELNRRAGELARRACEEWTRRTPERPRFVAGSVGPLNKTLSLSPDVENPAFRAVTFDEVRGAYAEQIRGLIEGGVDLLLLETIFDTLNAKAAIVAASEVFAERGVELPLVLSATVVDRSGRTLSGQTLDAFWVSVEHARPLAVGLNCSLGAAEMRPHLEELARAAPAPVICYPNAGLPNAFGGYDEAPPTTARLLRELAEAGLVNVVGGCCGTTPDHIRAVAEAVEGLAPREPRRDGERYTRFSGLESFTIRPDTNFVTIGERTNVAGSRRFASLIRAGDFDSALAVALEQVRGGANILDVNMDEALLDSAGAMTTFLSLVASDPEVARLPIMIDSSRWDVIEAGLKCVQGKCIVNSISLKEGEEEFLERARRLRRYGAAVVVMAFDETGQAETADRKVEICERAYRLLTEKAGFDPLDIVFDPNVLAVATGIEQHNEFAVHFIEAIRVLKQRCPGAKVSGGVSNLSFSFRGNHAVREAIHSAFLYHAIRAGMDMGIVNAGQLVPYDDIPKDLLERVEDVLFDRRPDATERLVELAEGIEGRATRREAELAWRAATVQERLAHALLHGTLDFLDEDLKEARGLYARALDIIEGPLMDGMRIVGDLFGAGKMFLPQVVKSARAMKRAVAHLLPYMESDRIEGPGARGRARVLLATVKGDVHDIGKNIVGVVLGCNGYDVIDLGVMVPCDRILKTALDEEVDVIGLSGLITPSLDEMAHVASEMERRGIELPLLIGGATTSKEHTAVRIAPRYGRPAVHVLDASRVSGVLARLLDPARRAGFERENHEAQERLRALHGSRERRERLSYPEAVERRLRVPWRPEDLALPRFTGRRVLGSVPLEELVPYIDWTFFFTAWGLKGKFPRILESARYGAAARDLHASGWRLLERIVEEKRIGAAGVYGFWPAASEGDDIVLFGEEGGEILRFPMLRQQPERGREEPTLSLADFVAPGGGRLRDHVGAFAVTAGLGVEELVREFERDGDDYSAIMAKALADRLAEAFAEYLHERARRDWGYGEEEELSKEELIAERYRGIRPAFGYPACPDHGAKRALFELLDAPALGITLTESCAMTPAASVSGLYLAHPLARYFSVGRIDRDQVQSYAARRGYTVEEAERWLGSVLAYTPP